MNTNQTKAKVHKQNLNCSCFFLNNALQFTVNHILPKISVYLIKMLQEIWSVLYYAGCRFLHNCSLTPTTNACLAEQVNVYTVSSLKSVLLTLGVNQGLSSSGWTWFCRFQRS